MCNVYLIYVAKVIASSNDFVSKQCIKQFVEEHGPDIYRRVQNLPGSANTLGGGSLALDEASVVNLATALIGTKKLVNRSSGKMYRFLWVGPGYGEEVMLLAMLLTELHISHIIVGIDIEETYINFITQQCFTLNIVSVKCVVMDVTCLQDRWYDEGENGLADLFEADWKVDNVDFIYTSAALNPPIFAITVSHAVSLKVLYVVH